MQFVPQCRADLLADNVVTYKVIIEAENPQEKLKPGLTVTITIFTNELKGILLLSTQAINVNMDAQFLA